MTTQERRKHTRITFLAPATLACGDREADVDVLDLSLKGALIQVPRFPEAPLHTLDVDGKAELHLRLDESENEIVMQTRVAHIEAQHVGLLCVGIDLESATHLHRLVELNLGDTTLLERELSALIAD